MKLVLKSISFIHVFRELKIEVDFLSKGHPMETGQWTSLNLEMFLFRNSSNQFLNLNMHCWITTVVVSYVYDILKL